MAEEQPSEYAEVSMAEGQPSVYAVVSVAEGQVGSRDDWCKVRGLLCVPATVLAGGLMDRE